jgi:hypothetical protein
VWAWSVSHVARQASKGSAGQLIRSFAYCS